MPIEDEIYTRLSGFTALTDLVGAEIYPEGEVPQGTAEPYVTYMDVSMISRPGAMGPTYGLSMKRFQFTAFSRNRSGVNGYDEARSIVAQLKAALDPWKTTTGTIVQGTLYLDERRHPSDESESREFSVDYKINYEE